MLSNHLAKASNTYTMRYFYLLFAIVLPYLVGGQEVLVEGYTFQEGNRGYLDNVAIKILDSGTKAVLCETVSDREGYFSCTISDAQSLRVSARRTMYKMKELDMDRLVGEEKMFIKIEMSKEPGYLFEVTLAEKRMGPGMPTDAIKNARIEIWNNTTRQPVLEIIDSENPEFDVNFKKGNHYTILIRKPGYLSKRMEAYVDVDGCILCFEGVGQVQPGVTDNLTDGNAAGVLLANVELEPIFEGKTLDIENIYYGLGRWNITKKAREQLGKVILLMEDNPNLKLELGSHTDSRGKSAFNKNLSEKRARASVDYIVHNSGISRSRVVSKGYGEEVIINKCKDGVKCSEMEHGINRRTELKILGIGDITNYKSLAQMKREEYLEAEVLSGGEVRVEAGEDVESVLSNAEQTIDSPAVPMVPSRPSDTAIDDMPGLPAVIPAEKKSPAADQRPTPVTVVEEVTQTVAPSPETRPAPPVEQMPAMTEEKNDGHLEELMYTESKPAPPATPIDTGANAFLNGHKVVIYKGSMLSEDHIINKRHSGIELYMAADGKVWYLLGGFRSRQQAMEAHKSFLSVTYPDSYVVTFENGDIQ